MKCEHDVVTDIHAIHALIARDMEKVDRIIQEGLCSEVRLINQLSHYIVNSGGKRFRPSLVLLSSGVFDYQGTQHHNLAAIIEFIHTATLLHDDVVDASLLRRGRETANQRWGNEASVLVGDFVYSRAFQMMVGIGSMEVMAILSDATNTIAMGEVQQLLDVHDPNITEQRYLDVICNKTAKLFEAAARLGAVIGNGSVAEQQAIARYGQYLGIAFQLIDDVLDYNSTVAVLGKHIGNDLAEGKPTLPLLYAMWHGSAEEGRIIRQIIEQEGRVALKEARIVQQAIRSTKALEYTTALAKAQSDMAITSLDGLPASVYLQALCDLAIFACQRPY